MKIANSNISFQKKLIAKTNVLDVDNKPVPAFIYQLEKEIDSDYFDNAIEKQADWKDGYLICSASEDIKKYNDDFFVIEDTEKNCLGYVSTFAYENKEFNELNTFILKLETIPSCAKTEYNRKITHIGKTLIDFLQILKCEKEKRELHVSAPAPNALGFYFKQGFDGNWEDGLVMKYPKYNEQAKIEFVG